MSKHELATVAMVTYNSEKYVAAAIDSVLSQSYTNLELVIVDDASTDRTWEIICNHSDSRIRRYRNAANLGEYPNRNKALGYAQGEYIIYIDGDDILYPHGLEFMVRSLNEFPNAAMAFARPWNEKIIYPLELTPREFFLYEFLGKGTTAINFAHLLFRTGILKDVGGFPTDYKIGDGVIQYRIALEHNCVLISDGLAWWRRTSGQASEILFKNGLGAVESLRLRMEYLAHPACPLNVAENRTAVANVTGLYIRAAIRWMLKGKISHGVRLLRCANIPLTYWRFALVASRFQYGCNLSSGSPLTSGVDKNPYYHK